MVCTESMTKKVLCGFQCNCCGKTNLQQIAAFVEGTEKGYNAEKMETEAKRSAVRKMKRGLQNAGRNINRDRDFAKIKYQWT